MCSKNISAHVFSPELWERDILLELRNKLLLSSGAPKIPPLVVLYSCLSFERSSGPTSISILFYNDINDACYCYSEHSPYHGLLYHCSV